MNWSIGQVARRTGLSADTLRYYEKIGLLPQPDRTSGGRRIYRERDLARLRFIRRAQAVGFRLDEIAKLVRFREDAAGSSTAVRELALEKHRAVCSQMETLRTMERELALLISICRGSSEACPILDRLGREAPGQPPKNS